uniref:Uncharacterized protein n=1 Tax=Vitis vinifera TaxID=29760 RepID=A5C4H1_VITVI|nr:hypothetical protein VITISV_007726 [Vitis vinifera]
MIRTTYPDRVRYRSGCDVHKYRVLLLEGVRIAWRRMSFLGIRMELRWIAMQLCGIEMGPYTLYTQTAPLAMRRYLTPKILSGHTYPDPLITLTRRASTADIPPFSSPNISHPAPDVGWERRRFNFPGQTYPDPLIALT